MKSYTVAINGSGWNVQAASPVTAARMAIAAESKKRKGKIFFHEAGGLALHIYVEERDA